MSEMTVAGAGETGSAEAGASEEKVSQETSGSLQGAPVEASEGGEARPQSARSKEGDLPPAVYREVRKLRKMAEDLAPLRDFIPQIQQLMQARGQAQPQTQAPEGDFWSNPEGRIKSLFSELSQNLTQQFEGKDKEREMAKRRSEAAEYIQSHKEFSPDAEDEIAGMIEQMKEDPVFLSEVLMNYWASKKLGKPALPKGTATGVAGAAPQSGKRYISMSKVDEIMRDPNKRNTPEAEKLLQEATLARNEGRLIK